MFDNPTPEEEQKNVELRILKQPEEQHRARYMSEGSRGAIKDRSGKSHCTLQLLGYNRPTRVQIYAGTGQDPLEPHPLYKLIPVTGKGGGTVTTPCQESLDSDHRECIEIVLRPDTKMTAILDCIGILKICTHDIKRRVPKSMRNSSIRLVFRAFLPAPDNSAPLLDCGEKIIQTISAPISCVQQLGFPEVHKVSLTSCQVKGATELFIIGKNFDKNTAVFFREYDEQGRIVWTSEAPLDRKHLSQCHVVCTVPTYRDLNILGDVQVSVTVECGKKISHPLQFTYQPDPAAFGHADLAGATTTASGALFAPFEAASCSSTAGGGALAYGQEPAASGTSSYYYDGASFGSGTTGSFLSLSQTPDSTDTLSVTMTGGGSPGAFLPSVDGQGISPQMEQLVELSPTHQAPAPGPVTTSCALQQFGYALCEQPSSPPAKRLRIQTTEPPDYFSNSYVPTVTFY